MLETARLPHFGLLIKHGLSMSAPGWARLWGVGVAGAHTWPGEHPARWDALSPAPQEQNREEQRWGVGQGFLLDIQEPARRR